MKFIRTRHSFRRSTVCGPTLVVSALLAGCESNRGGLHSSLPFIGAVLLILHVLRIGNQGEAGPALSKDERRQQLVWKMFYMNPSDP
jgi:hypothetical protein